MKSLFQRLAASRFFHHDLGAAAVEFALIAPLLLLFYAVIFECGRGWLAQRKFHATIENAARFAARFPEFDVGVRTGLPLIVARSIAPLGSGTLDLALISAKIDEREPSTVFEYDFVGDASSINWRNTVRNSLFAQGEPVIVVTGRYAYAPLFFGQFTGDITFEDTVVLNPFFSRSYAYSNNNARWDYFNVQ